METGIFTKEISFKVAEKTLSGTIISRLPEAAPDFAFFHGSGAKGDSRDIIPLSGPFLEAGHSIFSFDFSGVGKSSGEFHKSSLAKRVQEAKTGVDLFMNGRPRIVSAMSMGGHVALRISELFPVEDLILFCPAIYSSAAFELPFDQGFTEAIRRPESWKDSDALISLDKFQGNLLVIIGQEDEVIPSGVIDLLDTHAAKAKRKEILRIPGCSHAMNQWFRDNPLKRDQILRQIAAFIG